jgi:hypothetical protein
MTRHKTITNHDRTVAEYQLLSMICRHTELYDSLAGDVDDAAALAEMCQLELRIAASPAYSPTAITGKKMVIERANFSATALQVIEEILAADLARIGG